ncbi:serine/threonine protein kinase [Cronobacter sakazakii]|uniref:serine/threonine protein kinase n=1 Tax=Cronobacter sakazakii TaxID=28141 RepID=UPI000CF057DB|nr:serine/threonine protein kinase [Cronobacter sakazakii]EJQ2005342.1 serine/threonine protein kinase [Cronobacter sakazakii]EJQ2086456.1 serine/threonine protein kinase [Cronobacter sakazakii]EJR9310128.1 serine/threonine protein kinase [Cronobacter sakazakii]EJR9314756.1 serine/threonine protein kinase [Cronobacter sakazakii]EJR9321845.1 serine/threonine protein kinase [Cronobacter sakazakii]
MHITIEEIVGKPFTFTKRPEHLPCDMRPLWRCSLILLILSILGRSGCCSLKKMHVVNWVLKSDQNIASLEFWILNKESLRPEVRMDPTLDRALELMLAEGFIIRDNDKYKIVQKGEQCAAKLIELDVFKDESFKLHKLKKGLSETNVNKIFQVG